MLFLDIVLRCYRNGKRPTVLVRTPSTHTLPKAGIITLNTSIIKGGVEKFALKQPIFLVSPLFLPTEAHVYISHFTQPSPVDPMYSAKVSTAADIHSCQC